MPRSNNELKTLIKIKDVNKTYDGSTYVVRDLCLDIYEGEFLALLGPSGSGKSTTLGMLAGFEHPTSGTITLNGKSLQGIPTHKRNFGMVFQNYSLFPHMSIIENVMFPLRMRGMQKAEAVKRAQAALETVDLGDPSIGKRKPDQLSGGQQQRIALARSLVFEPVVILFDEPLGALDKRLREQMQLELRQIHKRLGVTMIFVTHDQSEALTMADRVAVFNDGKIQQIASPMQLYDEPETLFVASFVGENNSLATRTIKTESGICQVELENGSLGQGVCPRPLSSGTRASMVVRPERIVVAPADGYANKYVGKVTEVIELGDQTRLKVFGHEGSSILVKIPRAGDAHTYEVGQPLTVGWRAEDCRILQV